MFPIINNIMDVLPAIQGRDEFIVAKRNGYQIINYNVAFKDTFFSGDSTIDAIRRECRGLTFDDNGDILVRKYHKFFNINENESSQINDIDLSKPHIILNKLDGSLINTVEINGVFQFHTKMGHTDVAIECENFFLNDDKFYRLYKECVQNNMSPIYEYTSPTNRIVVAYNKPALTLTAIRQNNTGMYMSYDDLVSVAKNYNIDVVSCLQVDTNNINDVVQLISQMQDIEGFVLRFNDGTMYKIKCEQYIMMHKAQEAILREKDVWHIIAGDGLDDFKSLLSDIDREVVERFENELNSQILNTAKLIDSFVKESKKTLDLIHNDVERRKAFAMKYLPLFQYQQLNCVVHYVLKGQDAVELLKRYIVKNSHSQTDINNIRNMFGNIKYELSWNDFDD